MGSILDQRFQDAEQRFLEVMYGTKKVSDGIQHGADRFKHTGGIKQPIRAMYFRHVRELDLHGAVGSLPPFWPFQTLGYTVRGNGPKPNSLFQRAFFT